ncbi:helix-turn-helix domain-containing protein [Niveispirillum fermenti]|uniref:helix-turn-helix domain-containing protein n=1 Tax=Niveispirillum fermenti TaxID=1233113 RepID=UPI003A849334
MVRAVPIDLRLRVVAAIEAGEAMTAVAGRFGISISTARRLCRKQQAGASLLPDRVGGRRQPVIAGDDLEWLRSRLAGRDRMSIRGITAELAGRGLLVTHDTVWRTARRLGFGERRE